MDDTRQRIARASRFFARLQSFDLECPHCGKVYVIRAGPDPDPNWDPWTARFRCTKRGCGKRYILGILAWPIVAAPRVGSAPPMDQVPSPRQLAALRREGGGWWLADADGQRYPRPHETNLTLEEDRPDEDDDTET